MLTTLSLCSASIRRFSVSSGTMLETLSYSVQYPQLRLHRRVTMSCASTGALPDGEVHECPEGVSNVHDDLLSC